MFSVKNKNIDLSILEDFMKMKVEACGFILNDEKGEPYIYLDNVGSEEDNRASCTLSKYSEIIWHTHPFSHKAYPSIEDIIKILKPRLYPKISLIFTSWGIWELYAGNKDLISKDLNKAIQKELDTLYFKTDKGRSVFNESIQGYIDDCIKNLERICKHYQLQIKFSKYSAN